jgi:carbon storage regulator
MLVLTRRPGERIRIGEDIEVVVVSVRGDGVRLGLIAPKSVSICRSELIEQVSEENVAAAQSAAVVMDSVPPTPPMTARLHLKSTSRGADTESSTHPLVGSHRKPERRPRKATM